MIERMFSGMPEADVFKLHRCMGEKGGVRLFKFLLFF